jgi:hypothetical protein
LAAAARLMAATPPPPRRAGSTFASMRDSVCDRLSSATSSILSLALDQACLIPWLDPWRRRHGIQPSLKRCQLLSRPPPFAPLGLQPILLDSLLPLLRLGQSLLRQLLGKRDAALLLVGKRRSHIIYAFIVIPPKLVQFAWEGVHCRGNLEAPRAQRALEPSH